jgi:hypothetical protein
LSNVSLEGIQGMTPMPEFVIYFPNATEQTKHGDIEEIKVIRLQIYILKAKKYNIKENKRPKGLIGHLSITQ